MATVIAVKRSTASSPQFLSHIVLYSPDHNETVPPDFTVIRSTPSGEDANLNPNAKGSSVYLCTKYSRRSLRITRLLMVPQKEKEFNEGNCC